MKENKIYELDVRDEILEHLEANDRKLSWLADKTGYPYSSLYSIFSQKIVKLSATRRAKINEVLGTKF